MTNRDKCISCLVQKSYPPYVSLQCQDCYYKDQERGMVRYELWQALTERKLQGERMTAWEEKQKLREELATERETAQQALQTSQTWHERQKTEIIAQWKEKLTTYRNRRKTQLQQEITLIKEVLND